MIIKRITVKNFGSVEFYDTVLTSKLNILDTLFTSEISTAIELVLCSKALQEHNVIGVRDDTLITAEVLVAESIYYIELKPTDEGLLKLTALDDKEKEFLFTMFAEMKNAVFADYQLVDYINGNLKKLIGETDKDSNGLVNIKTIRDKLEAGGDESALELWFVNLFEDGLKDLIGLHVVVKDEEFPDAVRIIETKTGKEAYSGVTDFFLKKIKILFSKFDKDKKNKQARLKINAAIKVAEGVPIPVEMCLYERTDYENETYGLYNHKKMSEPHYIYKMGKNFNASLFEHIFAKEMDYSFIDPTDIETKQMVYESDGIIPTGDLAANFREIIKKISGNITCFVEYEDGVYVQKLPEGSTVFDLATSRYFSDDINVAVYRDTGDQITSDVPLDDTQTYKIIKRAGCFISVPASESDIHTTRAKLIYKRLNSQNKADISEFIKSIGTIEDIPIFSHLMDLTESRKDFISHDLEYYKSLYEIYNKENKMNLFIGSVNTKNIIDIYSNELTEVNDELKLLNSNESLSKSAKVKKNELEKRKEKLLEYIDEYQNAFDKYGEEIILNAHVIMEYGNKAWVLYAGNHNILMSSYSNYKTYYEHIKHCYDNKIEIYDQFGTIGDLSKDNPRMGLHDFKKKFGGFHI